MEKDIWIYLQSDCSSVLENSLELLGPTRKLASAIGGRVIGVAVTKDADELSKKTSCYDFDVLKTVEGEQYEHVTAEAYAWALERLVRLDPPHAILFSSTLEGRTLASRLAAKLRCGLVANCTKLEINQDSGRIAWISPTMNNSIATIFCKKGAIQMGMVRPGVFQRPTAGPVREVLVQRHSFQPGPNEAKIQVLEIIRDNSADLVDLSSAQVIVAGGRGVGSADGFQLLKDLAEELGGVLGATRPVIENGWLPHTYQIGQSGKSVRPRLYIACGISGAIHHTIGMSDSETIVAINKDPEAPIFRVADYGIVGDLFEVVPALIAEIRRFYL